jgi:hypothetical protein
MSATSQLQQRGRKNASKRVQTVLRVAEDGRYAGDVLLDGNNRVWRHARTIPADVVLRVLRSFTRQGEVCGTLVRNSDGQRYEWFVVGAMAEGQEVEREEDGAEEVEFRVAG